ncbi:Ribosomal protein S21 [Dillenia turbinata]|uniref:Ribosomal protein S21 n=1 Tax=Dillenia turbinata TaxID=194707 RepID=A0AAN8VEK6_9MAGN
MATNTSPLCSSLSFLSPSKPSISLTTQFFNLSLSSPLNFNSLSLTQKHKRNAFFKPSVSANEIYSVSSSDSSDSMSVMYPSLVTSNILFFRSAYNVQVIVEDNEPEEKLLNRFRREVMKAGVIQECKRRRFFENKQDERKRKSREAAKRNRRRRPQARTAPQANTEGSKSKKDEEEDNWELPEGGLPF